MPRAGRIATSRPNRSSILLKKTLRLVNTQGPKLGGRNTEVSVDHSQVHIFDHKGLPIAYEKLAGAPPAFVWLGGFRSDMAGTKAEALADWARRRGQAFLRFDYSGHGRSGGRFEDGTITRWLDDALGVIDRIAEGRLALVGSSMGAWIALWPRGSGLIACRGSC